ncbi:Histone-lysine N-methyltransferase setd3 [Hondaea fermentalgiana]|uniref:Histone-lysine N-methyltransferase setd3 n=1 Tax=Hondaea fermentalgiana TaxID=2315210 RepID=A0A2R5GUG9_9STRA|nr:Histone-lysine N-methyltransferase setd3 [Hondaea fermentalgiana]|eukprot:GBG31534.1 Histone-lysine N-methyltransferase setd3 [Hondaea fermentalgiana]
MRGDAEQSHGFEVLASWVREHDGRVDRRLSLQHDAASGTRGVVASADIEANTEILVVPWKLVIGGSGEASRLGTDDDDAKRMCALIDAYEHILATADPWYAPYVRMDGSMRGLPQPMLWSDAALEALQGLPPQDCKRHVQWYIRICLSGERPQEDLQESQLHALVSFITRSSDRGLIPVYDLLNHHNGLRNVAIDAREDSVAVVTLQKVTAGEQLYNSYGEGWSHELFRDYGFVEPWPQLWGIGDTLRYYFLLFPDNVVEIMPEKISMHDRRGRTLAERSAAAATRTASLSMEQLAEFAGAARAFLQSLPTTADEDEALLSSFTASSFPNVNQSHTFGKETMLHLAIDYRRTYKRAIETAMTVAMRGMLDNSRDEL